MGPADNDVRAAIDGALREWRQGDCVLGEHHFLFRLDVQTPLTEEATRAAVEGVDAGEAEVRGFMVATQSCDIVRSCRERPFVEVCPLVQVEQDVLSEIRRARRPVYAYVPGVADKRLVADLDRVMTVEKAVVAKWDRIQGCTTDDERRRLALSLARKRVRVAFPDDFVQFGQPLMKRMSSKHDRNSDEGRALRALREVRVRAAPSWDAEKVELTFYFIRDESEPDFEGTGWDDWLEGWLERVSRQGRFISVDGLVSTLEDLTAKQYVESDPLDLDYLSQEDASQ